MLIVLVLLLALSAAVAADVAYVNEHDQWTVYLPNYEVKSVRKPNGHAVHLSSSSGGDNYVAVNIYYQGKTFVPESLPQRFPSGPFDYFAHVHSDPCESNNGTHWKADKSITTAVESNELWFQHSYASEPDFASALTPHSHAVPASSLRDPDMRSLTIHEPKIGTAAAAAKLACIPLKMLVVQSTLAPTPAPPPPAQGSSTLFVTLVTLITLAGLVALCRL